MSASLLVHFSLLELANLFMSREPVKGGGLTVRQVAGPEHPSGGEQGR